MNNSLFFFLYSFAHQYQWLDTIVSFVAGTADKVVLLSAMVYLAILFLIDKDWKEKRFIEWVKESVIIGTSIFSAWLVSFIIKNIAQVPRPFVTYPQVVTLINQDTLYDSFPSGHATIFFALATAIYLYSKPAGIIFYVFAFCIAISRVIAGVHYPVDIFFGAIIGTIISFLVHRTLLKIIYRKNDK